MANQSSTPFDQGLFLVHLNRGREHFDKRSFGDAAEELEEARRLRPDDDSVLNLLGLAYFKQEKYKEADSVYRKLIDLNPESYTLHFNLGLVCCKTFDLDNAEAIFLRALELKPENQKTHFYLGNIYEKKKQFYNAIFQYRKAGANIMVKRVQKKIDRDHPTERHTGEDFSVPTPSAETTSPNVNTSFNVNTSPDVNTSPNVNATTAKNIAEPEPMGPDTLEKINVDHIDRRRFLSALQHDLFNDRPPTPPSEIEPVTVGEETSPNIERPPQKAPDTQEAVLSVEEQSVTADAIDEQAERTARPAVNDETIPPTATPASRLRLTEPIVSDQSLSDMAKDKMPARANEVLFSNRRQGERRDTPSVDIPPAEALRAGESDRHGRPKLLTWGGQEERGSSVYARMRRSGDIFRYLENNLMEVNFSGKVFIKQGTIYSYSGNLTFWVKPQRDQSVPALVIVSGTGKLLLTDRQRDISVMQIEDEEIFVEPSHLLACQDTLTPRYAVIEKDDGTPGLHVLMIKGAGVLALSVATSPLLLTVQKPYPVNVSSSSLISWTGELAPTIVEDEALAEIMLPSSGQGVNLRLEGEGRVMMEKSSPR